MQGNMLGDYMKKKILLILAILLLTGCKATYDINFDSDKIYDEIRIYDDSVKINQANDKDSDQLFEVIMDWENGYDYYKRELYSTDKVSGYKYTYDFTYDEYEAMTQLRKCYEDFDFKVNNEEISLKTSKEFLCGDYYQDTEEIVINIKSKYEIKSSNADKNSNNTYTWIINSTNYKNKPINFTINKQKEYKEPENKKFNFKGLLLVIIFIALIVILKIRKRRNK